MELILEDIIVAVRGMEVENYDELAYALEQSKIGEIGPFPKRDFPTFLDLSDE